MQLNKKNNMVHIKLNNNVLCEPSMKVSDKYMKVRVLIDFDNDDMILQRIDEYDDIIDYYDINQKINFLKLFRDILKMKKIQ